MGSRSDDPTDSSRTLRLRGVVESEKLKLHESNGVMFRPHRVVALVGVSGHVYRSVPLVPINEFHQYM